MLKRGLIAPHQLARGRDMQMHWSDGNLFALEKHLQSMETPGPTAEHKRDAYTLVIERKLETPERRDWVGDMLSERPELAESIVQSAATEDAYADDSELGRQVRHAIRAYLAVCFADEIEEAAEELAVSA